VSAVRLSEPRQAALAALLALEPTTGDPDSDRRTLEATARLIPCDAIGLGLVDLRSGSLLRSVSLPTWVAWLHPETLDDTCTEGIHHLLVDPPLRPLLQRTGMSDGLLLRFRDGRDQVGEVWMDRRHRAFTDADLSLLRIINPLLCRLLRDRPDAQRPPVDLTAQERRVLQLVATGMSNADVAARMWVAPCTVRKHLQHAFRKLGVSNRLAAVQALEGASPTPRARSRPSPERE